MQAITTFLKGKISKNTKLKKMIELKIIIYINQKPKIKLKTHKTLTKLKMTKIQQSKLKGLNLEYQ